MSGEAENKWLLWDFDGTLARREPTWTGMLVGLLARRKPRLNRRPHLRRLKTRRRSPCRQQSRQRAKAQARA